MPNTLFRSLVFVSQDDFIIVTVYSVILFRYQLVRKDSFSCNSSSSSTHTFAREVSSLLRNAGLDIECFRCTSTVRWKTLKCVHLHRIVLCRVDKSLNRSIPVKKFCTRSVFYYFWNTRVSDVVAALAKFPVSLNVPKSPGIQRSHVARNCICRTLGVYTSSPGWIFA